MQTETDTQKNQGPIPVDRPVRCDNYSAKDTTLGDYFTHERTGLRFICCGVIDRDTGDMRRQMIVEVKPSD
jgi:hypothetical protein